MATTVMGLGRGLIHETGNDEYFATGETIRRADEMADYYHAHSVEEMRLVVSGGFPEVASRGEFKRPPAGICEARFMDKRLVARGVPKNIIKSERNSGSTFENLIRSIEAKFLQPGQFDPDNPLIFSAGPWQPWRSAIIARQSLAISNDSKRRLVVQRLPGGNLENNPRMYAQERVAYALTKLALLEVDAQPGNLDHTRAASKRFNHYVKNPFRTLNKVGRHIGFLMSNPDVPEVAPYATTE